VAGAITGAFTNLFKAQGRSLTVQTVHRYAAGDAHGLILFFVILALLISTVAAQAIANLEDRLTLAASLVTVVLFAILAGPLAIGVGAWLANDYGQGVWLAVAFATLFSAAVGAVVAGGARLLGGAGVGVAALVVILLGLVTSGGPLGSQFLPDAYRWFSPAMPVSQLYSAFRGVLFYDNAGLATPIVVLIAWLLVGLLLIAVSGRTGRLSRRARPVAS
jgi:hypothetical protein